MDQLALSIVKVIVIVQEMEDVQIQEVVNVILDGMEQIVVFLFVHHVLLQMKFVLHLINVNVLLDGDQVLILNVLFKQMRIVLL